MIFADFIFLLFDACLFLNDKSLFCLLGYLCFIYLFIYLTVTFLY